MKPTIAVDLAKSVFEIAVSRHAGTVAERHRLARARFQSFFAQREAATVLVEACGSAHFWARELESLGHQVVLLPPHLVRPYRRRHHKTDCADAKALLEAFRNAEIHPVPAKSVELQTLASLHRLRSGWLATRTARINAVRGILRELGVTIAQGAGHVVPRVRELVDDAETSLPEPLQLTLAEACFEIRDLERRNKDALTKRVVKLIRSQPRCVRTMTADNGTEFHDYKSIEKATGAVFYFANPYHSWERGSNENTNGLIRQYLPKTKSMALVTQRDCAKIAEKLNNRPRKRLGFKTPKECYEKT